MLRVNCRVALSNGSLCSRKSEFQAKNKVKNAMDAERLGYAKGEIRGRASSANQARGRFAVDSSLLHGVTRTRTRRRSAIIIAIIHVHSNAPILSSATLALHVEETTTERPVCAPRGPQ